MSFSWVLVIAKGFKPFWGCLFQSGWFLCGEQTRANPRASPAGMWQTGLCPSDITEMCSQPKYHISWWNNLCFVFSGQPWGGNALSWRWGETGRMVWGAGRFHGACSVPMLFPGHLLWPVPETDMTQCHHSYSPVVPPYFAARIGKSEVFRQFLFQSSQSPCHLCDWPPSHMLQVVSTRACKRDKTTTSSAKICSVG